MRFGADGRKQLSGVFLDLVDRQHDQRLGGDIANTDDLGGSQPVAKRQPQPVGRDLEDFRLQRHAVAQVGGDHDCKIELAADQQMLEIVAIVLDGRYLHRRMGTSVARQKVGEHVACDQRRDAELELARGRWLAAKECAARVGHVGQDLGGVAQELVAFVGDVEAPRMALKQLDAEIALQFLDRLGD